MKVYFEIRCMMPANQPAVQRKLMCAHKVDRKIANGLLETET